MFSSHDRSGGNDDGFTGAYSSLYKDSTGYVLFDAYGPGCLYRIWTALPLGDLKFYFDDEDTPRIALPQRTLFSGAAFPFLFPLAGDASVSSGGYYSYVPFPFTKRLKISSSVSQLFYQFSYQLFPHDVPVRSYTGHEDISGVLAQWTHVGKDPKKRAGSPLTSGTVVIRAGETQTMSAITARGSIAGLRLMPSTEDPSVLRRLVLRIFWDGEDSPSVSAPLWDFFGAGAESLLFGRDSSGWFYCWFPMPFRESERIEAANTGSTDASLSFEILRGEPYSMDAGRFHAQWREEDPTSLGNDYTVIVTQGRGKFVGTSASMQGANAGIFTQCTSVMGGPSDMCFLEGDERVYVDGALSPALYGTGTEDYFNAGWYFINGTFSLPLHGQPSRFSGTTTQINAYRIHLGDSIPFESSLRFGREVGPADDVTAEYGSVAYYYAHDDGGLILTDKLDVGDPDSESLHGFVSEGSALTELTSEYEGEQDKVPVSDIGRVAAIQSSFVVRIAPVNNGVKLRVRKDMGSGIQKSRIFIDGQYAGIWYLPETNPYKRWRDADLEISGALTRGKSSLTVAVVNDGAGGWDEYRYWVYSHIR